MTNERPDDGPDPVFAYRDGRSGPHVRVEVGFTDRRLDLGDHAPDDVRAAGLRAIADAMESVSGLRWPVT